VHRDIKPKKYSYWWQYGANYSLFWYCPIEEDVWRFL
jgi:hypothetical protein